MTFLDYSNPVDNRYGVTKIPQGAAWGEGSHDKILRYAGEDITIWIPSILATKWLRDLKGDPPLRANVGVIPLRDMDREAAVKLLRMSNPSESMLYTPKDLLYLILFIRSQTGPHIRRKIHESMGQRSR